MRIADLWRWEGKVGRETYALVGLIGFAIKNNLDRYVAVGFRRPWPLWSYWAPLAPTMRITSLTRADAVFVGTMLALSLPFIWLGVTMTVKRLRDAGQPVWLVGLFFVPVVNLLLFALLSVMPARVDEGKAEAAPWPGPRALDRVIPRSGVGSAALAIVVTMVIGLSLALLGTVVVKGYGWGLFVALPFCLGLFSVLLYGYHQPRGFASCMGVAVLSVGLLGLTLLTFAVEGLICLIMAAPIALCLVLMGGALGYAVQRRHWSRQAAPAMLSVVLLFVPAFFGIERAANLEPPTLEVRSAIEVNAPPEIVWKQVVAFSEIPPPKELLFRAGIAYPIRAEMIGRGVGAERHCIFSTGAFVEPIEVWDAPRLLKFGVTANPAPMQEWTPYAHIQPPHLHGFLVSRAGQFQLTPLPGGRTRLEGTTWYRHTMWPAAYWQVWSDGIIHRIHLRVLEHIRTLAEKDAVANAT
ncbi:MAG TPA: DUF805 domain-containing protein [Candidatus Acidoferrum sp.]|nr:DUF805 domain-containing protein [Candidatus Acidoferrum sp.]